MLKHGTRTMALAALLIMAGAAGPVAYATETLVIATKKGDQGNLIKLDGQTLEVQANFRSDYWPAIASLMPLSDGRLAVIPFKDDVSWEGNRASMHLVDGDDFSVFGYARAVNIYTHTSTTASTKGGATGGIANRFGEVFMFAPSGRFHDLEGAMTLNALDPKLPAIQTAFDGDFDIFTPNGSSSLSNGDWVLVMNRARPPKDKHHLPGRVQISKRHDIKSKSSPSQTLDGLPRLTTSATNLYDHIALGDIHGNVYELHVTENQSIRITKTRQTADPRGAGSIVSDIVATADGNWVVAINATQSEPTETNSGESSRGGGVWVLEQATLEPLHHITGLAPVTALAVNNEGNIIIGTASGTLRVFDSTLTRRVAEADGFDAITHVVVLAASQNKMESVENKPVDVKTNTPLRHPNWTNALKPNGEPGPPITLAHDGQSDYYIICAAKPTTQEIKAAMDLAHWLGEMTRATFQLIQEDLVNQGSYILLGVGRGIAAQVSPSKFISIGRTRLFAQAELEIRELDLGNEGYTIAQHGENIYLIGGDTRGIINSVYALLEEDLGCRWYTPHAHSIPFSSTLTFRPMSRSYTPVLTDRRAPHYSHMASNGNWSLHNRTMSLHAAVPVEWGGYAKPLSGFVHTFNSLIPKSEFKQHPEYFMMKEGKRNSHQLCLTNSQVRKIIIEKTLARLKDSPNSRIVDISPNDGGGTCACGPCKTISDAEGSNMGPLLDLVNAVADAVKDDYPNVRVTTLAYLDTKFPPKTIRPRDNVLIWLCTDDHNWEYLLSYVWETPKFDKALKAWGAIGAKMVIWDYPIDYHSYAQPLVNMPVVTANMRYYVKHGATGIFLQAQHLQTYGVDRAQMRSWVWAKQLWDLDLDTKKLVRDFNQGFYGQAAEPMQRYDDMMWSIWEKLHKNPARLIDNLKHPPARTPLFRGPGAGNLYLTTWFTKRAMALFDEASQLAGDNRELIKRIELAKLPVYYVMAVRGAGSNTKKYLNMLDDYERIALEHSVKHVKSGLRPHPDLADLLKQWRTQ